METENYTLYVVFYGLKANPQKGLAVTITGDCEQFATPVQCSCVCIDFFICAFEVISLKRLDKVDWIKEKLDLEKGTF